MTKIVSIHKNPEPPHLHRAYEHLCSALALVYYGPERSARIVQSGILMQLVINILTEEMRERRGFSGRSFLAEAELPWDRGDRPAPLDFIKKNGDES